MPIDCGASFLSPGFQAADSLGFFSFFAIFSSFHASIADADSLISLPSFPPRGVALLQRYLHYADFCFYCQDASSSIFLDYAIYA